MTGVLLLPGGHQADGNNSAKVMNFVYCPRKACNLCYIICYTFYRRFHVLKTHNILIFVNNNVMLHYVIKGKMPMLLPGQAINTIIARQRDQLLANEEAFCPAGK